MLLDALKQLQVFTDLTQANWQNLVIKPARWLIEKVISLKFFTIYHLKLKPLYLRNQDVSQRVRRLKSKIFTQKFIETIKMAKSCH